jgi:hypothetical protein
MSRYSPDRRVLILAVVLLLGALLVPAQRRWRTTVPAPGETLDTPETLRTRALDQTMEETVRRARRKDRVLRALLAGRLSLLEAAGYFRALELGSPPFHWEQFRSRWPGSSDAERHCHEVIDAAHDLANRAGDPRGKEVCNRLRGELAEHLRRGPLLLPEPAKPLKDLDQE